VFDSWLRIVTVFVSLRLYSGVYIQGLVKFSEDRRRFSSSLQGLTLTLTLVWTVVYLIFHDVINQVSSLTTVQMLAMLVMIWATSAFSFWAGEQRVEYRYKQLVIATLLVSVAKPVVGILFVKYATDKVTARILGLMLVELVGYTGLFVIQMLRGKQFFSKFYWKYAILFNLPLIPHYLSQQVLNHSDRIMIKSMIGPSQTGIYGLAYSISQIMILFNTALVHTLSPWFYQKIKEKKVEDISGIGYLSMGIIAVVNLALIAVVPEVVKVFAPPAYHEAIWVIPPVAMSVLFLFSYDLFAVFEFYYEKTRFIMTASLFAALLNVVLNYIFIKKYGYYAAAYTTLFCYMADVLAHYIFMRRICDRYLGGVVVYKPQILCAIYGGFMVAGFGLMATYRIPAVRYAIVALTLVCLVIWRKKAASAVHRVIALRKKK
jgi:O-antigen/teichoic acid export membrane protein